MMTTEWYDKLLRCTEYVRRQTNGFVPEVAMVLGSGLGDVADAVNIEKIVPYSEIPGMPVSTVQGHAGQFLFGTIGGVPVVCMQGRLHYYEGYDVQDVVLPIRIMGLLGAKKLFLSNAAGGLDPKMQTPSLMTVTDHIMLSFPNPLVGPNIEQLGPRFPDMSDVYDEQMRKLLLIRGLEMGLPMSEGVYVQVTGPSFETPAEVRMLGELGAGAVGMSTACEAVAARHMGMKVCCVSCITNKGAGIADHELTHEEVVQAGHMMGPGFSALVTSVIPELAAL